MRRILVIDDEDDIRQITAWAIHASTGWLVDTVGSGAEGIEHATAHQPDAILLDVSMPTMDGPATLRELKAIPALTSVPVIFLTARAHTLLAGLGAAAVFAKPFDPRTLASHISSVLCWS